MPEVIKGSCFNDSRGSLCSFNEFDMSDIKRMYHIAPAEKGTVRAWQGHKFEKKWFICIKGSFEVKLIKVDDFGSPSAQLAAESYILTTVSPEVLYISGGYANGFKATEDDSRLMVFSNYTLAESKRDDYRFDQNFWDLWRN